MAITNITSGINQEKGITYSAITDNSIDWSGVTNSTYFYDKDTDLPYYKSSGGTVVSLFEEGGVSSNVYTADGTLTGNRTVDLDSNDLTLTGGTANFEFGGFWQGFTRWDSSGAVQIKSNGSGDPFKIYKKVDASNPNFVSGGNGGGHLGTDSNHWTVSETYGGTSTRIEIDSTYIKQYHGATLHHNNKLGGSGSGVQFFQGGISGSLGYFIVGGNTRIGTEKISLQEDTLVTKKLELSTTTDGFLMPRLTTAQMNAISSPDTHLKILNIDENREYRYNGSTWVSNEYVEYDFALRSSGSTTYYDNFYSCYNASVAGDVIDVQTDQAVDCGGIASWTWTNDITINLNGHHINCINLQRLYIQTGVNVKMTNGTFSVESTSINTAAIMFKGGNTFVGDGAVTVYQTVGGSTRGSFTGAGARSTVSGVIMKGSATYCVGGFITVDNCILYKPTGGPETIYGDNVIVNNSIIYGPAFGTSGNYNISSRETVRRFNNCTIITDGESAVGSRSAIFSNCSITTNDDEIRIGIGGEQEYYNCKIERTGTVGTAFQITNTSNVRMYNTEIISTGTGVVTNRPMEFYNCYIKSNGGDGIRHTSTANDLNLIVESTYIEATGGSCMNFDRINEGVTSRINNSTLICNTTNKYCLQALNGSNYQFTNTAFKNTATTNDIYSRAGIPSENTQIETTDAFGNIILK